MDLQSGGGGCSTEAHGIRRQDFQAAILKAAELRALHAALFRGGSGGSPTVAMLAAGGSPLVPQGASKLSVQEDYPVFAPSYEEDSLPGYNCLRAENRSLSQSWNVINGSEGEGKINEADNKSMNNEPQIPSVVELLSNRTSSNNRMLQLQIVPESNSVKSLSERTSSGECRTTTMHNTYKQEAVSLQMNMDQRNLKNTKGTVASCKPEQSVKMHLKHRGPVLSWLFPKSRKKTKPEDMSQLPKIFGMSPKTVESEDMSQLLKEWGALSLESLKKELLEANENKDAALAEVSEMRFALGELQQKLVSLETYCEELKKALKQATHAKSSHVQDKPNLPKRMKSIGAKKENIMPVSEEVMVEGFLQIVSEARLSVKQFCKTLVQQIEERDHDLSDKINLLLQPYQMMLNCKYSKGVIYHLEALVNQYLYQDFENCVFRENGSPRFLDPRQGCWENFSSFVSLRNLSWNEVLQEGTKCYSEDFSKFCDQKMGCLVTLLNWSRPWPEEVLQCFFVAAKCIWMLHLARALNLFSSATVSFDAHSLLEACAASEGGVPCFASAVHAFVLKLRDPPWNKLLRFYCRVGLIHHAHQLFDEMPRRDVVSYNTLITSHARADRNAGEPLRLYGRMLQESLQPDHITLTALLDVSNDLVEQIHSLSVKLCLNSNPFVGSALVNQYERRRGLEEAIQVFEEIEEVDLVSWNIVIDVCARRGSKKHAAEIFSRMRKESPFGFDCFTLTSVLKTCSETEDLNFGMQLHGCSWKAGLVFDAPIGNALITMYSKCGGEIDSAVDAFDGISNLNIISWTSMIAGLVQNGLAKEAVSYYHNMVRAGMLENGVCFASVLPAFSKLSSLDLGRMVHSRIVKLDVFRDVMVANALVDMYFKCGNVEDAELAFTMMQRRDTVSWTIMINGFGQHGKGGEALQIFRQLERSGANLDTVTFLAVLSTCSHGGLIDEGIRIFHSMVKDHNIKPMTEHYACVIDMLGRAGRLDKAERFIQEMGLEKDSLAWEALLGACGIHGAIEMGEKSAEKVMELEPHKDGPYILLSNIYAQQKMWVEKERLRKVLDASVSAKEVGYSWSSGLKL